MISAAEMSSPERAAAFMVAIGAKNASPLLEHMSEEEIELITSEVTRIGKMTAETRQQVMRETYEQAMAQQYLTEGGLEYARALLTQWKGNYGEDILNRLVENLRITPFAFVRYVEPDQLAQFLKTEHPQTIALVLAHQAPRYAASFMAMLDPDLQTDVAHRIATMGRTSPDVVRKLEQALQLRLGSAAADELTHQGGVSDLAEILNHTDRATERVILEHLSAHEPELAEQVRALMFVFEDIVFLDDRAVQEIVRNIDAKELAVALKGVKPNVRDIIHRNLSERARLTLQEEMEIMGPVPRRDVEEAQGAVVRVIRQLDEDGTVVINRGGDGELIE